MKTNYSFVKSKEELDYLRQEHKGNFFGQEKIQAFWFIDEGLYRKLLPPRFEPTVPLAFAYVANFARPENLYPYTEGGLFIACAINGKPGAYCLAMPVDGSDQAMDAGREFYGYPKKYAIVKLERRGNTVKGYIERNDVRYFQIEATAGELNDKEAGPAIIGPTTPGIYPADCYMLKYDIDVGLEETITEKNILLAFRNPRIQQQFSQSKIIKKEYFHVDSMKFEPSEDDPWCELEPVKIIGAEYTQFETYMGHAETLYTYTEEEFEAVSPYLFTRWDTWIFGKYHASYKSGNFFR